MYRQDVPQTSLQSVIPDLATGWSWNRLESFADFIDHRLVIKLTFCSIVQQDLCWHKCSTKDWCD
jgi:hypothetical protein